MPRVFRYCGFCRFTRQNAHNTYSHHLERCVFCKDCRLNARIEIPTPFCVICAEDLNQNFPNCDSLNEYTGYAHFWNNNEDFNDGTIVGEQGLPDGWEESVNAQGRMFWIDYNTGMTTFNDPRLSEPPAYEQPQQQQQRQESNRYTRTQCDWCGAGFENENLLQTHWQANAGCRQHGVCFPVGQTWKHAKEYRHTKCFMPGCQTKFALEHGWADREIEDHVFNEHVMQRSRAS